MTFANLTQDEFKALEEICIANSYSKDEIVITETEEGSSLYIVKEGMVEARKDLGNDQYTKLKQLGEGGFFGEISFLNGAPRSATVVALDDTQMLELQKDAFNGLIADNPVIGQKLYEYIACELASRLRSNTEDLKKAITWAVQAMNV